MTQKITTEKHYLLSIFDDFDHDYLRSCPWHREFVWTDAAITGWRIWILGAAHNESLLHTYQVGSDGERRLLDGYQRLMAVGRILAEDPDARSKLANTTIHVQHHTVDDARDAADLWALVLNKHHPVSDDRLESDHWLEMCEAAEEAETAEPEEERDDRLESDYGFAGYDPDNEHRADESDEHREPEYD